MTWHGNMKAEHLPEWSMDFMKKLIDDVGYIDLRWRNFPLDRFNVYVHPAHKALYHALRNKHLSLQKAVQDAKKQKEAKRENEIKQKEVETKKALEEEAKQAKELSKVYKVQEEQKKKDQIE